MRRILLPMVPLALLGCSAPTPPSPAEATTAAQTPASAPAAEAAPAGPARAQADSIDPLFGAVDAAADPPAAMLNHYVAQLLNGDRKGSDDAWTFPPADPRHADDAALRQLPALRALRFKSGPALARDGHRPPRLLEIPVQVRADTAQGSFRFSGWYRVQPSVDGRSWQIQSAQLHPTLD